MAGGRGSGYDAGAMGRSEEGRVRLDKWLWAARFYKTRSQASLAVKAGKVAVAGVKAKPGQPVTVGNRLSVRKGPYDFEIEVVALAERRGSAEQARGLYVEDAESVRVREEIRERVLAERRNAPRHVFGQGRPTKKHRRDLMAFRGRFSAPEDIEDIDI